MRITTSIICLAFSFHFAAAHEPDANVETSTIGGKMMLASPSGGFVKKGGGLRQKSLHEFDFDKGIAAGTKYIEEKLKLRHPGFVRASFVNFGGLNEDLWYVVLRFRDDQRNIANLIVNARYEVWPVGEYHDPFAD